MPAEEAIQKFHSALRWGKPSAEIEPFLNEDPALIDAEDPKNGNHALHITAQNGHEELTKFLVGKGANINAQNKKGQTALHMSVEYDFYYQNLFLLENGADKTLKNGDGHAAILGIDGGKSGVEAFDGPMIKLKAIRDQKGMEEAFTALENAAPELVDKAQLAQVGMKKKKEFKDWWDMKRFAGIMGKF